MEGPAESGLRAQPSPREQGEGVDTPRTAGIYGLVEALPPAAQTCQEPGQRARRICATREWPRRESRSLTTQSAQGASLSHR